MSIPLDNSFLQTLLTKEQTTNSQRLYKYERKNQHVAWVDQCLRCASRGCSSPTYIKIDGVPRCFPHSIDALCDILNELEGTNADQHT